MATKLFIGRLSFDTTDASLNELFATYGTVVSAQVATDGSSSRSKGFGFVEMESQDAANSAINALNDHEFEGRSIVVSVARPKESRPEQHGNNFRGGFQPRR